MGLIHLTEQLPPDERDGLLADEIESVPPEVRFDPEPALMPVPVPVPVQTTAAAQHRSSDLGALRVVIVLWCFWLLGAWAVSWLSDTSVPRVRWMLFAGSFGLMLVWPAYRLSEPLEPGELGRAVFHVLADWLAMVVVYQAVIWSLHLIAFWPFERGLWLDAAVLAWSLLSALIVAVSRLWPGGWARGVGMLLCIALVFAEPVAMGLSLVNGGGGWSMRVSPVQAMWELTGPPRVQQIEAWSRQIMLIGVIAVSGWVSLVVWAMGTRLMRAGRSSPA